MLVVSCPTCGHQVTVPAAVMGKSGRCMVCGAVFQATPENSKPAPSPQPRPAAAEPAPKHIVSAVGRIVSIDQLRGYAILGMILVNYLGNFHAMPWFLEHQRSCYSYPDTIAPLFVFVVGMGFRLSLSRRIERQGEWLARWGALKRYLALFIIALFFYGPDFQKNMWDALTEIALAGILALLFIDKAAPIRLAVGAAYMGIYTYALYGTGYGQWLFEKSMNGGPLGPLTSAFPLMCGTIAYDLLDEGEPDKIVRWSLIYGVGLCLLSLVAWKALPADYRPFSAEHGPYWSFAARWLAPPFTLLSTGLCFLAFLFFYYVCDVKEFQFPHLSILGENPLVVYLLQYSIFEIHHAYIKPTDTSTDIPVALVGFVVVYLFCYACAKRLHDEEIIIKL